MFCRLKCLKKTIALFAVLIALAALTAPRADEIDAGFRQTMPYQTLPPLIDRISNTAITNGAQSFMVTAEIRGQLQQRPYCPNPGGACLPEEWVYFLFPVDPNPPQIKSAKVYYYKKTPGELQPESVDMVPAPELGSYMWKATVPLPSSVQGDVIVYYLTAIDGRGNVTSQVPDTGASANLCPSTPIAQWPQAYSTPAQNNCAQAETRDVCGVFQNGAPTCGSSYTLNDPAGDVCGEPSATGTIQLLVPQQPKLDLIGISALADKDYLCINTGMGAQLPVTNDTPPFETFSFAVYNPDMFDDNLADSWIKNGYLITYIPEVVGTDPTLVRVLWDAACLTNPDTPNPSDCRPPTTCCDSLVQTGYGSSLITIVKKGGTGNPHTPYNLIGSISKRSIIVAATGELNLSGGTPFWFSDTARALGFMHSNQERTVSAMIDDPAPPFITAAKCSADGAGQGAPDPRVCKKSQFTPLKNVCKLQWNQSPDFAAISEYRIYESTSAVFPATMPIGIVPDNDTVQSYSYNADISFLDGKKTYFFITSYNASNSVETHSAQLTPAYCVSEDWEPPATPAITTAKTPAGTEKKCELSFTMPGTDDSLKSFYMKRDGIPLNQAYPMAAEPGATSFTWRDPEILTINTPYSYTVTAVDLGGNERESAPATCTPEDLKAPARIDSLIGGYLIGKLGVRLEWQASTESDLSGYNAYKCPNVNLNSCRSAEDFTRMNSPAITGTEFESQTGFAEGDYCFYAEACDNCKAAGTCDSNPPGVSNCSGFPPGGKDSSLYVKCAYDCGIGDEHRPAFPNNVSVSPSPDGSCVLTWIINHKHSDGMSFCDSPPCSTIDPRDLNGHKVMRCQGAGCGVPSPSEGTPVGLVGLGPNGQRFDDKTVLEGVTYRYSVYATDFCQNSSENGPGGTKTEVECTPHETLAPSLPVMNQMQYSQASCTPSWQPVSDPDTITYKVFRCDGNMSVCNASDKFTEAAGCVVSGTECTENLLDNELPYTYCVTATDQAIPPNQSAIFPAGSQPNCVVCVPSTRPRPPSAVTAAPSQSATDTLIFWTLSPDDDGTQGGYNIYRCPDAACATKTKVSGKACTNLLATSSQVQNVGPGSPIVMPFAFEGTFYYGVSFQEDCIEPLSESQLAISNEVAIEIPPCSCGCNGNSGTCVAISNCDNYTTGTGCDPLKEIDTSQKDASGFVKTPKAGISFQVYKPDGTPIGGSSTTDSNGNFLLRIDTTENPISPTEKYRIVIKIPAAQKAGYPCSPGFSGGDCIIVVKETPLAENPTVNKVSPPPLPKPGGGRAEVGNANCDSKVNLSDFTILRQSFGKNVGDGAQEYADFNGDGKVNLSDFTVLRQNFGKNLDAAPAFQNGLCKPE